MRVASIRFAPCARIDVEETLDQNLIDVVAVDLRVAARRANDGEPLTQIGPDCRLIVGTNEGEDLLVGLLDRGVIRRLEQPPRDPLAAQIQIDVRAEHTDVGEGGGIRAKRLHALKSHDALIAGADRDVKDAARWKGGDERTFFVDRERPIEHRVGPRLNRLIQDSSDAFSILDGRLTNEDLHAAASVIHVRWNN